MYDGTESSPQFFRKEAFLLKVLAAAVLFVGTAVVFRMPAGQMQGAREAVASVMEEEMQFAFVADWYEKNFGKPLVFLPSEPGVDESVSEVNGEGQYAVPAAGQVLESFEENGEGIIMGLEVNSKPAAVEEGLVIFAGKKETSGNTLVIQHKDGSESWYGNLTSMEPQLYDAVSKGEKLGTADGDKLFFAIKMDKVFVNPDQVISFE